jgi:hypothetical protein
MRQSAKAASQYTGHRVGCRLFESGIDIGGCHVLLKHGGEIGQRPVFNRDAHRFLSILRRLACSLLDPRDRAEGPA